MELSNLIGTIGVAMMLIVFLLNITDKLHNDHPFYIVMNIVGSSFACAASFMIKYIPFVVLEGTWCVISMWALYIYFKRDYKKPR